jgi:hypothetical protein
MAALARAQFPAPLRLSNEASLNSSPIFPTNRCNGACLVSRPGGTLTCTVKHRELEPVPLEFKGVACSPNFEAWAAFT